MPDYDFRSPRLHLDADLAEGMSIPASPQQANYLSNVLRLEAGASVLAFNGRDGEWLCEIEKPAKKKLDLVARKLVRPQTPPAPLLYCFAPLKHARLDYMVQKAVEMGAGVLQPVMTQHVQAGRLNLDRMRANAVEAAEQCGILTVPECREPVRFVDLLAGWDANRPLVFCDERAGAASPVDTLTALRGRSAALLVGPEGGFSHSERDTLRAACFTVTISLGPRILRADTAAVAALAVFQASAGDWQDP